LFIISTENEKPIKFEIKKNDIKKISISDDIFLNIFLDYDKCIRIFSPNCDELCGKLTAEGFGKLMENNMLNSKERAALRSMAAQIQPIMQIGKGGISENLAKTVSDALEARELIKLSVLENCDYTVRDMAEELAEATHSEVVAVIGRKVILYRESKTKKRIEI
jgi:RNA-binding protein